MVAVPKKAQSAFSLEEKKKFCEDWRKTNLSRSEFIRRNNLPSTFHGWCNKLLENPLPVKTSKASPIMQDNDKWLQLTPGNSSNNPQSQQKQVKSQDSTEFKLICNDIRLIFCMPMDQIILFTKELYHATTTIR